MIVIGLMSGTSLDGVDGVACRITGEGTTPRITPLAHIARRYPPLLQKRLLRVASGNAVPEEVIALHKEVGRFFGAMAETLQKKTGATLIGSHGQTISHLPRKKTTLQIGDACIIATKAGLPVWSDFRVADIRRGGEGAPLAPIIHLPLFASRTKNVAVLNLGGVANITFIPKGRPSLADVIAFDTVPANMLIDMAVQNMGEGEYDQGGEMAAHGVVDAKLLALFLRHPYFRRRSPKSTGREEFGVSFIDWARGKGARVRWNKNLVATLTELTARSVAHEVTRQGAVDRLVICGGGAKNDHLVKRIASYLGATKTMTSDTLGIPCQWVEAMLMALMAWQGEKGTRLDLSRITGARPGAIIHGQTFR